MKILVTGASGQLGTELIARLQGEHEVVACSRKPSGAELQLDLADRAQLDSVLNEVSPDLLINTAAYTQVDQAEQQPEEARAINTDAPAQMADWACKHRRRLVHFSTDYVYSGQGKSNWRETDSSTPVNEYGRSKLAGDLAIQASGCRHLILRTSWIYSSHGKNFMLTMLRLAAERDELKIVGDQFGCPTWAGNLAEYTITAVNNGLYGEKHGDGLYHCSDETAVSWYEFACEIVQAGFELGLLEKRPRVTKIGTSDFPTPAKRPPSTILNNDKSERMLGISPRPLGSSLKTCMKELLTDERRS